MSSPIPISEWVKTPERERLAGWLAKPSGTRDTEVWAMCRAVYVDESGSGDKDRGVLLLAAYVSTTERWMRFADEWAGVLSQYKLREIHTKELWDGEGDFDETRIGWEDRKKIIRRCEDIVQRRAEVGLCVVLRIEDYNDIVRGNLIDHEGNPYTEMDYPYHMLFKGLVGGLLKLDPIRNERDSIAVFFDENDQYSAAAQKDFAVFKRLLQHDDGDERFSGPRFENSKKFLPLQAADMLAWSQHRSLTKRKSFEWPANLPTHGFMKWSYLDRNYLTKFIENSHKNRRTILEKAEIIRKRGSS